MNKLLPKLLGLLLACTLLTINIFGASCGLACYDIPDVDEEFDVSVVLNDNPGIKDIILEVRYPTDTFSLINCTDNKIFDGFFQYMNTQNNMGILVISLSSNNGNNYSIGSVATLTFSADDTSAGAALMTISCTSAVDENGNQVTFDGATTAITFVQEEQEVVEEEEIIEEEEILEEEEIVEDEEYEEVPDEEVTTSATKKTDSSTKKTEKSTEKTSSKTEKTTTEATTTSQTTTSETTTSATTSESTAPAVTSSPESSESQTSETTPMAQPPQQSDNKPSDGDGSMTTGNDYSGKASKTTVVLAVSILLTAIIFALGIEIYKRYFMPTEEQADK